MIEIYSLSEFADAAAREEDARRPIVCPSTPDGVALYSGETSMILGDGGAGKGWFSLSVAVSLAVERTVDAAAPLRTVLPCELDVEPSRVLVVSLFDPPAFIVSRIAQIFRRHFACDCREEIRRMLGGRLHIAKARDLEAVEANAARLRADLVIVDPLVGFAVSGFELDADKARETSDRLRRLARETGAHVMVAHHTNKASRRRPGAMVLADALGPPCLLDGFADVFGVECHGETERRIVHLASRRLLNPGRLSDCDRIGESGFRRTFPAGRS